MRRGFNIFCSCVLAIRASELAPLEDLAYSWRTDKSHDDHKYVDLYSMLFDGIRERVVNLTEVGVAAGQSLGMWHDYFPRADVWGLDISEYNLGVAASTLESQRRVHLRYANSQSASSIAALGLEHGSMDIIIDDGAHDAPSNELTLLTLWPYLKPGGYYCIEDVGTGISSRRGPRLYGVDDTRATRNAAYYAAHVWESGASPLAHDLDREGSEEPQPVDAPDQVEDQASSQVDEKHSFQQRPATTDEAPATSKPAAASAQHAAHAAQAAHRGWRPSANYTRILREHDVFFADTQVGHRAMRRYTRRIQRAFGSMAAPHSSGVLHVNHLSHVLVLRKRRDGPRARNTTLFSGTDAMSGASGRPTRGSKPCLHLINLLNATSRVAAGLTLVGHPQPAGRRRGSPLRECSQFDKAPRTTCEAHRVGAMPCKSRPAIGCRRNFAPAARCAT